jgi:hypothetical protein
MTLSRRRHAARATAFSTFSTFSAFSALLFLAGCGGGGSGGDAPPVPTALSFSAQPATATPSGTTTGTIAPAVKVTVLDQYGAPYTGSEATITLSIGRQPNTGIYQGALLGTTTAKTSAGVATFTDLSVTQIGAGYTLKATAPRLADASSAPFSIAPSKNGYSSTRTREAGYEIVDVRGLGTDFKGTVKVYIDQPGNPITADAFANYSVSGWFTNSPRYAVFEYALTLGSPRWPPGPLTPYTDPLGYTWGAIADVKNYDWPFDAANYPDPAPASGWQVGNTSPTVAPGTVKYTHNDKNQVLLFPAVDDTGVPIERFFVTDPWGNVFIMKSSNAANDTPASIGAAFDAAVLPDGWTKSRASLTQDLFVPPIYGGTLNATFLEFRDSGDNAYSQVLWGERGDTLAQRIGAPMPLWTGPLGGRLNGTPGDDAMYGGPSDDRFHPLAGKDRIDGGAGTNTVVVTGRCGDYALARSRETFSVTRNGITVTQTTDYVVATGPGGEKTLSRIQHLQCDDTRIDL